MTEPTPNPRRRPLVSLERFGRATRWLPAHWRLALFGRLPHRVQDGAWADLAAYEEARW